MIKGTMGDSKGSQGKRIRKELEDISFMSNVHGFFFNSSGPCCVFIGG